MVRYADEFVILCRTREEAEAALAEVQQWVETHELTLHPEKTNIVDARDKRFSFLGYSFRAASCFPREKSHQKFVNRIRELTRRKSGESLEVIIQRINRCSQRQFNYFRHGYWSIFKDYDGMIRRRLRHFLLKRRRRNRKRHSRTRRWPNVYFTERRFMSVNAAHVRFVQSIGTDWRAVCGKTVCTVRREGRPNSIGRPYPYLRS